jgi:squalene-hopene/tetraprenyl-beta-curcumene cyclase
MMPDLHPLFRLELRRLRWRRVLRQWLGMYVVSLLLAAGLGVLWAGDSFYNGVGPRATERWFYSFAVTQAPALAVWSALAGVGAWRRMVDSRMLAHALASPLRPLGLMAGVGAAAALPLALWVVASSLVWAALATASGAFGVGAVLIAHAVLLAQALAFGLLGPALVAASGSFWLRSYGAAAIAAAGLGAALMALFAVGPLLERCARPEPLIYAVLLVNPAVAMGTALNLDVLRTPWIYQWTPIPEYAFTYPAPLWTLGFYAGATLMVLAAAARRLGHEGQERSLSMRGVISSAALAALLASPVAAAPSAAGSHAALDAAVARGVAYLKRSQGAGGDWQQYPGVTAIAALALIRSGLTERDPAVKKAIGYLVSKARPDGGIYDDSNPARALPNYNTALAVTALHATGNPAYRPIIRKAQEFLARSQFDEGEGYTRAQSPYGGIGYGSNPDKPDLSNLQQALEALRETKYDPKAPLWEKAIVFLQRCQNRAESNSASWAGKDGGFVYASDGESKAGEHSSYGSMTYAGLRSYIYCQVDRSDPRVQAAWSWLRANYTVAENPGMGEAGLYYYYHTMAKTLAIWGQSMVTDTAGRRHAWRTDLSGELIRRQAKDGSWSNQTARWWEDNKDLVTGYSLLALAHCR